MNQVDKMHQYTEDLDFLVCLDFREFETFHEM